MPHINHKRGYISFYDNGELLNKLRYHNKIHRWQMIYHFKENHPSGYVVINPDLSVYVDMINISSTGLHLIKKSELKTEKLIA